MKPRLLLGLALACGAAWAALPAATVSVQQGDRNPQPWRPLSADEQARFQLGHAVFNTSWLAAGEGGGRRDGLGPLFNAQSCDSCHNGRRRGRGPVADGPGAVDLVFQVGRRLADGRLERGHPRFGKIINPEALPGHRAEATVTLRYLPREHRFPDGSRRTLWQPQYAVSAGDGRALPDDLVLMPRMGPQVYGAGLLEQVPEAAILARAGSRGPLDGRPSWLLTAAGRRLGRFGWQATEPSIASQTAAAFAREMGLENALVSADDCADHDTACRSAARGGRPEVDQDLFDAVVAFQQLEALRRTPAAARQLAAGGDGARLFAKAGCSDCHRDQLPTRDAGVIAPYTDLLLHDLGPELADRDLQGRPLPSRWRTAPLWGMSTALEDGREVRLLHDGRARSIEEAILWHGGSASAARERYRQLDAEARQRLLGWVSAL